MNQNPHHHLFFLFFILLLNELNGQTVQPTVQVGAKWQIQIGQGMDSFNSVELLIGCDTITIRGKKYYPVFPVNGVTDCGLGGYVREDTLKKQVFFSPKIV